jgi:hypothetical protein
MRLLSILYIELEIVFSGADGHGGHLGESATVLLTIFASTNSLNVAVDRAEEAMKGMDTMTAWEGAIGVIKQVLDTIGPIADVCLIDFPHPLLC